MPGRFLKDGWPEVPPKEPGTHRQRMTSGQKTPLLCSRHSLAGLGGTVKSVEVGGKEVNDGTDS